MSVENLFKEVIDSNDTELSMTAKQIRIMSTAIEIFAQKGYSATTTSEIAKKAGVGEGTIFHHYKTKKDLLLAIPEYVRILSFSKAFPHNISNILERPYEKFENFLRDIIENRREFASANVTIIKVLFQETPFHPELRDKISQTILSNSLGKFIRIIDKFKEQGEIINIPSISIVNLIFTTIFGYFFTRYIAMLEFQGDGKAETDYLIQYIMNGISTVNPSANSGQLSGEVI